MKRDQARLIAELNDLLQLDHDAVEAYTIAINLARREDIRGALVRIRAEHKERIEQLAAAVRDRGGLPLEMPHITAGLKMAVQAAGAAAGDAALLLAFKAVEGQIRDKFAAMAKADHPDQIAAPLRQAADTEDEHYRWVEHELARHGVGTGTMPHEAAHALEQIHKLLANPIETAGRRVKESIGRMTGTRGSRKQGGTMSNATRTGHAKNDVQQFIQALHELEEQNRMEPIVAMFDSSAEISNAIQPEPRRGQEGAREFWRVYRESFQDIHSEFKTVMESDGKAVLEWTSRGHTATGDDITYSGVSVLELDGGKVRRFRAYFDPSALNTRANA